MQLKTIYATLASVAAVLALDNAFVSPGFGQVVNVGETVTFTWNPTTGGKVNLILRSGGANDLTVLGPIASGVDNTGSFVWSPDSNLKTNTDYSVEIQDAANTNNVNFSPYFTILALGQGITSSGASSAAPSSTASSSSGGSSSAPASSTASSSAASSSHASSSGSSSTMKSSSSASSSSAASSAASSSASSSASPAHSNAAVVGPANAVLALGAAAVGAILL